MNCSPLPCEITIKKNKTAQNIPKTHGFVFWATSFMEVFRITQWHRKRPVITISTFTISKVYNTFSPSLFRKNIDQIMFLAVLNSLALKNTQVIFTKV